MKVRDVMNVRPITVQSDDPVSEATRKLRENKISGMPVLDGEQLVGVVSESDLLRLLSVEEEEGGLWASQPLRGLRGALPGFGEVGEGCATGIEEIPKKKVYGW